MLFCLVRAEVIWPNLPWLAVGMLKNQEDQVKETDCRKSRDYCSTTFFKIKALSSTFFFNDEAFERIMVSTFHKVIFFAYAVFFCEQKHIHRHCNETGAALRARLNTVYGKHPAPPEMYQTLLMGCQLPTSTDVLMPETIKFRFRPETWFS